MKPLRKKKTLTLAHLASSATSLPLCYSLTVLYLTFWPHNPIMQSSAWPVVVIPHEGVDSSSLTAQILLHFHQDVRSEDFTVTYNPPHFIHVTNPLKQSPDTAGAFLKDSVQMECEELFPSSLSFSHPSSIRPPPPPLRVLPNEALRSSMWVSYSESQQPRVPIWKLVTLSGPVCAADLTLSLSQMLSQTDPTCRRIQTHTAKSSSTPTLSVSSLQLFKETNS